MKRDYYSDTITKFLTTSRHEILAKLVQSNDFALEQTQRDAWLEEIDILQDALVSYQGTIFFEYSIHRMGKRIDVILLIGSTIFVLEFKVGETVFPSYAIDQVWDYALDLKNFHETSHESFIAPVLIATYCCVAGCSCGQRGDHEQISADVKKAFGLGKNPKMRRQRRIFNLISALALSEIALIIIYAMNSANYQFALFMASRIYSTYRA